VRYDLWHGYRLLQRLGVAAAYPFGFGLSYAPVVVRSAALIPPEAGRGGEPVRLAVEVVHGGAMAVAEVVQVYLEPPGRLLERPRRTLVAFERLSLQPGEQRRLTLSIPLRQLACFDPTRDAFVLEAGRHRLVVARHAEDPGLVVTVELEAAVVGP
jgi:beta-glucosidase